MTRFKRSHDDSNSGDDGHYYISISDLMTSLLFIFILILTYVMLSFVKKEEVLNVEIVQVVKQVEELKKKENILSDQIKKIEQNIEYRGELLQDLQEELYNQNINVEIDKENGNMRLKSDLLFKSGSADISLEGKRQIDEIAKLIMIKMLEKKYIMAIDTIFIEGHTDTVPIRGTKGYRLQWSNKELSAQRAINTYSEMLSATDNKINNLKNKKGKSLLSYSGYADTRQLCKEDKFDLEELMNTEELKVCRSKNRRIEFYFTVNTPDVQKMKEYIHD
jgi:flagellar motor protein MotB